jgi:hypothetical protein
MPQTMTRRTKVAQSEPLGHYFTTVGCSVTPDQHPVLPTTVQMVDNTPHGRYTPSTELRTKEASVWDMRLARLNARDVFKQEEQTYRKAVREAKVQAMRRKADLMELEVIILRQGHSETLSQSKNREALRKEYDEALNERYTVKRKRRKLKKEFGEAEASLLEALLECQLLRQNGLCQNEGQKETLTEKVVREDEHSRAAPEAAPCLPEIPASRHLRPEPSDVLDQNVAIVDLSAVSAPSKNDSHRNDPAVSDTPSRNIHHRIADAEHLPENALAKPQDLTSKSIPKVQADAPTKPYELPEKGDRLTNQSRSPACSAPVVPTVVEGPANVEKVVSARSPFTVRTRGWKLTSRPFCSSYSLGVFWLSSRG